MLENPGEELYFGEVYRQILQESWLPEGSEEWERLGLSRRGIRPTQKGLLAHSPTDAQEVVRQCFSKCAAAWRSLPWDNPTDTSCDNRWGKQYWYDLKHREGYSCSYYDLYMRFCMKHCLSTGCIPPANYLLAVDGDLSAIECNKVYDLAFPNKCGEVSMVTGAGQFVAPSEWVSPKSGTDGILCFKDENGSFGSIPYTFVPPIEAFYWDPANPDEIAPDGVIALHVLGGGIPTRWEVAGEHFWFDADFTLKEVVADGRSVSLFADDAACGSCTITVTDACTLVPVTGYVRCTAGQWVVKSTGVCGLSGVGRFTGTIGTPTRYCYELISGYQKQTQETQHTATGNYSGPCPFAGCLDYCSGPQCVECVGNGDHPIPCENTPSPLLPKRIRCWRAWNLIYSEWEC